VAFAATASLSSFAGGWAVATSSYCRVVALALLTIFGLALLWPALAVRLMAPLASIGSRLSQWTALRQKTHGTTAISSVLLGVTTGLVWAPCAGPVLGLILTGAALRGPSAGTLLLLLAYALGAATPLAAGLLFAGRFLAALKRSARWGDGVRCVLGVAVIAGAAAIWLGLDTSLLTRWSAAGTNTLERFLVATFPIGPGSGMSMAADAAQDRTLSGPLASLLGAQQWLNTEPLHADDLRGKVVVVNFWTYSCINCLRALPYVRDWAERYRDRGLVVIGVETPEFAFEKDLANVRSALGPLGVGYPVAIDNDFAIWRAFDNEAWPAFYFIGADGRVRDHVFGEGDYDRSERLIQKLLSEANGAPAGGEIAAVSGKDAEAAADARDLRSPETYVGYSQAERFASPGGVTGDISTLYRAASALPLNHWGLAGVWTVGGEFAALNGGKGSITYRFHARDLHLVMAATSPGHPIRFRVMLDGAPPGTDHGSDTDADGWGSVQDARLYQLVRQTGQVADRTFEIEFFDAGVRAYCFTFG